MKIIAYNVEFGKSTTPKSIAGHLRSEHPDIVCISEAPKGEWTALVADELGMQCSYVGSIASANHEQGYSDKTGQFYGKFKSILSRTPLSGEHEVPLQGTGWSPVSVVFARAAIEEKEVLIGSLHIPTGVQDPPNCCAASLAETLSAYGEERIVIRGDYNDLADSLPLQSLYRQGFRNSWHASDCELGKEKTCNAKTQEDVGVIDHVLYRGSLEAIGSKIIKTEIPQSDHYAISATFVLE